MGIDYSKITPELRRLVTENIGKHKNEKETLEKHHHCSRCIWQGMTSNPVCPVCFSDFQE